MGSEKMRKRISGNQLLSGVVFVIFLFLQVIEANFNLSTDNYLYNLRFMSFIGVILVIYIIVSWKKSYYRFISPYILFILLLFVCLCGQTPFWMLNIKAGFRDLTTWMNLLNSTELCKGLLFSYLCLSFLHSIVLLSIDPNTKKTTTKKKKKKDVYNVIESKEAHKKITIFGLVICFAFLIPYLITFFNLRSMIKTVGYDIQYDILVTGTASFFAKIADFYPLGIITLIFVWGKKNEFNEKNFFIKRILLLVFSTLYIICELLLGQRTGVILFIFALLFVIYRNKNIPLKNMVIIGIGGVLLMGGMRLVGIARSNNANLYSENNNPIVDFVSDTGWNLMSLVEFQKILPSVRNYGYGSSYLISLTEIVPNINLWAVHPAYKYGNISQYLRDYLGYSFGLGCTPVAESYYNFSYFGFLVFYLWGLVLISLNRKFEENKDLINNYMVVLFIGILLKSCIRSSFYAVFRPYLLFVLFPVIVLKLISNKKLVKKEVEKNV